ncbi:MAG: FAD binding domain-containing protein [Bacilli bacterium]|jgi:CO/xanthine dehydrogenase FAD-binding subunit
MDIQKYYRAPSLQAAYEELGAHPQNAIIGGGLWLKKVGAPIHTLVDLIDLDLHRIEETPELVKIGALVSLRELETHPSIAKLGGGCFKEALGSIMGVALRRMATIGGSLAGKYPFSDIITPLLVLEATVSLYPNRQVSLRDFLSEKGKRQDILTHLTINKNPGIGFFKKVSNTQLDFAILNVAILKERSIKIAVGSRPGSGQLAVKASEFISSIDKPTLKDIEQTAELAVAELGFASTTAASGEYRQTLARAYIKRGLKEVCRHEG